MWRAPGEIHRGRRDLLLGSSGPAGEPLDHVPVLIARLERHPGIGPRRVAAERRLEHALRLDEIGPVHPPQRAEAGDAVRHHHLGEGEPLGGAGGGLLGAVALVVQPAIEPGHRGGAGLELAELRAQPRDELGGQRGVVADEAMEGVDQLHRPRGVGSAEAARPVVGQGELLEPLDGAQRHSTHVLHQPEPEHRRQRPELADGERCHLLERGGECADVLRVEAALGVGDETDRQVVDPRVTGERTVGEVGQLPVVPARKIEADLGDVVPDDVEVVEQPLSGRTDVERSRLGGDPGVRVLEDGEGPVEPAQQRADASGSPAGPEVLATGDGAGVLGEPLDAQQLAPDRAGEKVRPGAMARECAEQSSPEHSVVWASAPARDGSCGVDGAWRVHRGAQWGFEAPVSSRIDLPSTHLSAGEFPPRSAA